MNDTYTFYNLYCINMRCTQSIYHHAEQIQVLLNEENLLATHHCAGCMQPMTSAMEVEIEHITTGVGIRLPDNPFYDTSY